MKLKVLKRMGSDTVKFLTSEGLRAFIGLLAVIIFTAFAFYIPTEGVWGHDVAILVAVFGVGCITGLVVWWACTLTTLEDEERYRPIVSGTLTTFEMKPSVNNNQEKTND